MCGPRSQSQMGKTDYQTGFSRGIYMHAQVYIYNIVSRKSLEDVCNKREFIG